MKSKKLFAILTLVAFMMTLVPMAAFGAISEVAYSAAASEVKATNTSLNVYEDTDDLAKITITFKNSSGNIITGESMLDFYVKSDRDAEQGKVVDRYNTYMLDGSKMALEDGQGFYVQPDANGKVYVYVGSIITGSFKISIYNRDTADGGLLIGSANVTVSVGDGAASLIMTNDDTWNSGNGTSGTPYNGDVDDDVELVVTVKDGSKAIEGKTVNFQRKYEGGSFVTVKTTTTDEDGEAKYYFKETVSGNYEYRVSYEDEKSNVIYAKFEPGAASKLEPKTAEGAKIAKKKDNDIEFYVKDKFGNLLKTKTSVVQFKVSSAPADSKWVDDEYDAAVNTDGDGVAKFTFEPDKLGKYVVRIAKNESPIRTSAEITLDCMEFDKAASMKFKLKNMVPKEVTSLKRVYTTDTYGTETNAQAGTLEVYLVEANGTELKATGTALGNLAFASSNIGHVTIDDDGKVTVKKDAKDVVITVHDTDSGIIATYNLKVVGDARAIKATPVVTGKTAAVTLQYIDANGVDTFETADETYTIALPSGVTASNVKKFSGAGKATFELTATEYGKKSVTVLSDTKRIAATFEVDFVMPASEKPVIGAKAVTMFIGATGFVQDGVAKVTDVAPFIKDGRTFVAVRPVADAFGAAIGWNEATQTVTLTRSDCTVTIVIGSSAITVVKDGVTTTVTADVAAFIKDGRTVLPFRAVGDAFGATVSYDAATQAVSYVQ